MFIINQVKSQIIIQYYLSRKICIYVNVFQFLNRERYFVIFSGERAMEVWRKTYEILLPIFQNVAYQNTEYVKDTLGR